MLRRLVVVALASALALGVGQTEAKAWFGFAENNGTEYVGKTVLLTSDQLEVRSVCGFSVSVHTAMLIDSDGGRAEAIRVGVFGTGLPHSRGDMYLILGTQVCLADESVIELMLRPVDNAAGVR